jgi:hypothetical protein
MTATRAAALVAMAVMLAVPVHAHSRFGARVFVGGAFPAYGAPYPVYPYPYPYPYSYPYPYPYPPAPPPPLPGGGPDAPPPEPEPELHELDRTSYGLVQLRGVPDGADVDLDGRFWLVGDGLDQRWLALAEGEHTITVRASGRSVDERRIVIVPGKTHVVRFPIAAR